MSRRVNTGRNSMPGDAYNGKDDEDDWGMPIRSQPAPSSWFIRRLRKSWPIITLVLLFLLYRSWPESNTVSKSKHAYVLYATDDHTLCNAFMVFESLHRLGSKADRVLLHNPQWTTTKYGGSGRSSELLTRAAKNFKVKLHPVRLIDERGEFTAPYPDGFSTWDTSITKLRAFELTQYKRVLHLDSDILLYDHLDELFLLPKTPVAMPRAYWSDLPPHEWPLTSLMMLIEPNPAEMHGMLETLRAWRQDATRNSSKQYDMELLNHRFGSSAMVLPHRPYALLTAEFRRANHAAYLGTLEVLPGEEAEQWDPDVALKEAKLVHFSDWPLPKPWVMWPSDAVMEIQPACSVPPCRNREIWKGLYDEFRRKRKDQCRLLSVTAPEWHRWKESVGAA